MGASGTFDSSYENRLSRQQQQRERMMMMKGRIDWCFVSQLVMAGVILSFIAFVLYQAYLINDLLKAQKQ
jgi:hypothetical protein